MPTLPTVTRIYQHHHLDSTRWQHFTPRPDDIVISTPYKSGTTWMQEIVLHLIFPDGDLPARGPASPWLDNRFRPLEEVLNTLHEQRHQRCIKTHLALDGLPFYPDVSYIVVGRDPRDVFMSLWNHYTSHTPEFFQMVNELPGRVGDPFPLPPPTIHDFWRTWMSRGWFEWECEGWPYWGNMHHQQTWWNYRDLPNVLFVHFADLLADAFSEIQRIARFLRIPVSDEQITNIVQRTTLAAMRTRAEQTEPMMGSVWMDGPRSFFYKGTNGRWRDVLSAEEVAMYERTAARVLAPACRRWLEQGRGLGLHEHLERPVDSL